MIMNKGQVLNHLNEIFINTLNNPQIILTLETTAKDIPQWDSLSHIQLIVEIEKYFKIKFNYLQILKWENVGSICVDILTNQKENFSD